MDIPRCFGSWHTIYIRFKRWRDNGLFSSLLYTLQQKKRVNVDFAWVDSTTVGLHRQGSGAVKKASQSIRRGRKGLGTKIHAGLSSAYLNSACLSASNREDMKLFDSLWEKGDWQNVEDMIADKG